MNSKVMENVEFTAAPFFYYMFFLARSKVGLLIPVNWATKCERGLTRANGDCYAGDITNGPDHIAADPSGDGTNRN